MTVAPHESFLQNFAFPLWLFKIKLKLVWYERLQPCHCLWKRSYLPAPVLLALFLQESDQCHRQGWHVIGVGRYHRECGREAGVPLTASAVVSRVPSQDVTYNRRRRQGRAPTSNGCHMENSLEPSPRPLPPVYNRDTQTSFPRSPGTQKWTFKSASDPRYSFIHSSTIYWVLLLWAEFCLLPNTYIGVLALLWFRMWLYLKT